MHKPLRRLSTALATALLLSLAASVPAQATLKNCNIRGKERRLGATYVTKLAVSGISCRTAEDVVRAFHRCRRANGGADGYCRRSVSRFRCSETRYDRISTQFSSRVSCSRSGARIRLTYTQYT